MSDCYSVDVPPEAYQMLTVALATREVGTVIRDLEVQLADVFADLEAPQFVREVFPSSRTQRYNPVLGAALRNMAHGETISWASQNLQNCRVGQGVHDMAEAARRELGDAERTYLERVGRELVAQV